LPRISVPKPSSASFEGVFVDHFLSKDCEFINVALVAVRAERRPDIPPGITKLKYLMLLVLNIVITLARALRAGTNDIAEICHKGTLPSLRMRPFWHFGAMHVG